MNVERIFDRDYITSIVTHKKCWDACSDDGACDPLLYFPCLDASFHWLKVEDHGLFMYVPHNLITYEVHTLLPNAHGKAVECALAAGNWMFENTPCQRIVTNVPSFNRLALALSLKVGMKKYGLNEKSYMKNGIAYDEILLGISKGDVKCQQSQ